jgi:hypothetical protein
MLHIIIMLLIQIYIYNVGYDFTIQFLFSDGFWRSVNVALTCKLKEVFFGGGECVSKAGCV